MINNRSKVKVSSRTILDKGVVCFSQDKWHYSDHLTIYVFLLQLRGCCAMSTGLYKHFWTLMQWNINKPHWRKTIFNCDKHHQDGLKNVWLHECVSDRGKNVCVCGPGPLKDGNIQNPCRYWDIAIWKTAYICNTFYI